MNKIKLLSHDRNSLILKSDIYKPFALELSQKHVLLTFL